jgi:hypothetical protein
MKHEKRPSGSKEMTYQEWLNNGLVTFEEQLKRQHKEDKDLIAGLNLNTTDLYTQSLQACHAHILPCSAASSSAEPPAMTSSQANNV